MYTAFTIIGALLTADTLLLQTVSNGNLGTVLPAIMGAPLLLIGIFRKPVAAFVQTPAGHALKIALIACYAIAVLFFASMSCILGNAASKKADHDRDVLIVLGCGVRGERVSLTLKYRLDAALKYLEHSPNTVVIVSGGQGPGEDISEAEAMRRYLVLHGVDDGRIVAEDKSESTRDNFSFSKAIMDERFPNASAAFVTTAFHVYRAGRVAESCGIDAASVAAPDVWYSAPNNYLRECIAVVVYELVYLR